SLIPSFFPSPPIAASPSITTLSPHRRRMEVYVCVCVCVCVWGGRGRPWQGVRGEIAAVDGCLQLWCTYNLHMKRNGEWSSSPHESLSRSACSVFPPIR